MHLTVSKTLLCGPQVISEWFESPGQTRPFRQGYRTFLRNQKSGVQI